MKQLAQIILPCAGFGTRVGSPPAKEILEFEGQPLIQFSLNLAQQYSLPVHVITRENKAPLIEYLEHWKKRTQHPLSIQLISRSQEWSDTLLQSFHFWRERNILVLPDTRFSPVSIMGELLSSEKEIQIAGFMTEQPGVWGCVRKGSVGWEICDKPTGIERAFAWGVLGWSRNCGLELFQNILKSQEKIDSSLRWQKIPSEPEIYHLEWFKDLTR